MLIIFDLDDTLVQTSYSITPYKIEQALEKSKELGLPVTESMQKQLLEYNQIASSAHEAIMLWGKEFSIPLKHIDFIAQEVYEGSLEKVPIEPMEGAIEVLSALQNQGLLAIVSKGNPERQSYKMKKAGIDTSFFCKILFLRQESKQDTYAHIMSDLHIPASQVWVCGDRIDLDLLPAKNLGCITVHIRQGRGVGSKGEVDFSIQKLTELLPIIDQKKNACL